jgi:hypothetical protein
MVIAVRDSDEDDSESLESLEDLLGRSKGGNTSSSSPPEDDVKKENKRPSVLGVFSNRERQAIVGKDRLREILSKDRQHKFDISKLIGDHLDDAEVAAKLSTANVYYEASVKQAELDSKRSQDDQQLLADIIDGKGGDHDEVARVLGAMERTGALTSEQSFSFFDRRGMTDWEDESPPKRKLPSRDVPRALWAHDDTETLERAYREGAVRDSVNHGELPDSLLRWTFESIALERNDHLREAYVQCLVEASSRWTRTNLTAQDIQDVFETLGADAHAIRNGTDIVTKRRQISSQRRRDPKYLLSVLEVFEEIANDLDFTALSKLSSILARLCLDSEAMNDGDISKAVDSLLSKLLELPNLSSRLHVAERILADMGENLKDSSLQARLLQRIQATSPTATRLRILLAATFLLQTKIQPDDLSSPPSVSLPALLQYLRSPTFDLAHRSNDNPVDYNEVSALAQLLDIAVSGGGNSSSFTSRTDEIAFNRQVDDLADRVNAIFSSIADTGASHMRRTEAKEALGILHKRLLYEVRTKPRLKKSVFGGRDEREYGSEERSRGVMQNFLKKKPVSQEREPNTTKSSQQSETDKMIRRQLELSP